MTEQRATSTLAQTGTRPERRVDLAERVWYDVNTIIRTRTDQAAELMRRRGETPTAESARQVAFLMQRHGLERADIQSMSTSAVTANRVALASLLLKDAEQSTAALDAKRGTTDDKHTASNFNSALASAFEYMPPAMMDDFPQRLLTQAYGDDVPPEARACLRRSLRGVEREVATLRALHSTELPPEAEDWTFQTSTTEQDLAGVDFTATNPEGISLAFDVKARSKFDRTVERLASMGYITAAQAKAAHTNGYFYSPYLRDGEVSSYTCVFDADMFGPIDKFDFEDPVPMFEFVQERLAEATHLPLRKLGKTAIVS